LALFILYQGLVTTGLLWVLWNFRRNLKDLLFLRDFGNCLLLSKPLVSVLVPARNEERNIRRSIQSILSQDYENLEIIVLDDQSTDRTREILEELKKQYPEKRLKIVEGKALPKGWVGKNYACHQLAQEAEGEILLFMDADTWLSPGAVRAGLAALQETGSDFLSLFPTEVTGTIWERMIVPFMHFAPMCFLPFNLIRNSPNPLISMAVGQFMMFRRTAYRAIGGHASVRGEVVEDIMISRRIKEFSLNPIFLDGGSMVFCRMYRSLKEVWLGFSKFLFAVFQFRLLPLILVMAIFDALFLTPFFYLLRMLLGAGYPALVNLMISVQVAVIIGLRFYQSFRFQSRGDALLHPLSVIHINLIALFSVFLHLSGIGVIWKGRKYRTKASEEPWLDSEEEEESSVPLHYS
jgi:chlorobactene glucosyltransferase